MLKKYQQEHSDNATNLNFFKQTVVNMGPEFSERCQEFRKDKATMSFILRPLEINTLELNCSPFKVINEAALQLELEDLKTKDLWNSKFTNLTDELEDLARQKSTFAIQHK